MPVEPIPADFHTVTPYLIIRNAAAALEFYKQAFNAEELFRLEMPGDKIGHAEMKIGDSIVMLADEVPERDLLSPESLGGSAVNLMIYVEDVDARYKQAIDAGATIVSDVQDQFYGDRSGCLKDPFGHGWTIATHVEDMTPEEVKQRMQNM